MIDTEEGPDWIKDVNNKYFATNADGVLEEQLLPPSPPSLPQQQLQPQPQQPQQLQAPQPQQQQPTQANQPQPTSLLLNNLPVTLTPLALLSLDEDLSKPSTKPALKERVDHSDNTSNTNDDDSSSSFKQSNNFYNIPSSASSSTSTLSNLVSTQVNLNTNNNSNTQPNTSNQPQTQTKQIEIKKPSESRNQLNIFYSN